MISGGGGALPSFGPGLCNMCFVFSLKFGSLYRIKSLRCKHARSSSVKLLNKPSFASV